MHSKPIVLNLAWYINTLGSDSGQAELNLYQFYWVQQKKKKSLVVSHCQTYPHSTAKEGLASPHSIPG